jgi:phosphoribosylaminoimidazole-succinocarboxamide synthase
MKNEIYKGSSKILYKSDEEFALIMKFTDNLRLKNGSMLEISGKGVINNSISAFIMERLDIIGVENHLIKKLNMHEQLVQFVDTFPVQLSISNIACGRYVEDFGMEEGYVFDSPIIDFRIKNTTLKYPVVNEHQIISFGWLTFQEITQLKSKASRIFDFLTGLFAGISIRLVECKLEFGRVLNDEEFIVMLTDEISLDNCVLWDMHNNEKLGFTAIESMTTNPAQTYYEVSKRFNSLLGSQ